MKNLTVEELASIIKELVANEIKTVEERLTHYIDSENVDLIDSVSKDTVQLTKNLDGVSNELKEIAKNEDYASVSSLVVDTKGELEHKIVSLQKTMDSFEEISVEQKSLIDDEQDSLASSLGKAQANINTLFTHIADQDAEIKRLKAEQAKKDELFAQKMVDSLNTIDDAILAINGRETDFEIKVLEHDNNNQIKLNESIKANSEFVKEELDDLTIKALSQINIEMNSLESAQKIYIQDELLRLNDHVNRKLDTLKGEKGDCGEKGEKGESGFLRGVSVWEVGSITQKDVAVMHKNSIWTCAADASATEPTIGNDEWQLLTDGISSVDLEDGELTFSFASGKTQTMGSVGFSHKGEYEDNKSYKVNNLVSLKGSTFVALSDTSNRPPSDSWKLIAQKGAKGNKGSQGEPGVVAVEDMKPIVEDLVTNFLGDDE